VNESVALLANRLVAMAVHALKLVLASTPYFPPGTVFQVNVTVLLVAWIVVMRNGVA